MNKESLNFKIIVIGGGAAGFFSALAAKESNPEAEVILLERFAQTLSKVRVSGGGRCNVTHACFDPRLLVQHYPRGSRELLGPFHQFQPSDTIEWFRVRGVSLKEERDGRMFPTTDSSETIINCFLKEVQRLGIKIIPQTKLQSIEKTENGFKLNTGTNSPLFADRLILATGSAKEGWEFAQNFGHTIQKPVPSLFSFNIPSFALVHLSGVSVKSVKLQLKESPFIQTGPLLITHWGFSGPAALKLSAWGARFLSEQNYQASLLIDWLPDLTDATIQSSLEAGRVTTQQIGSFKTFDLPKNLWLMLCERAEIAPQQLLNQLNKSSLLKLCGILKRDSYQIAGKTTNKEEFVTCGGITLSEVNFKTMESKCCKNLFFCGEILDIDGITGGFNFQNAWTTGWIAGRSASTILG